MSTGKQFEITRGQARAVITEVGAGLRVFEVDGVPYSETFGVDEEPPRGAGIVLVPWPNRVAGARWHHRGEPQDLDITEPERGHAIHGLVRHVTWTVTEHTTPAVSLEVTVGPAPGWPFRFRTSISYELGGDGGLRVTHGLHNLGEDSMPFGVGAHPYPRPGNLDVDECELTLGAHSMLRLDPERKVPVGVPTSVEGTGYDLRAGRQLSTVELDSSFGDCRPGADGLVRHTLTHSAGGVEVWADPVFRWVQVFTPPEYPGKAGRAVAIEPMTCPPDALNSGTDLLHLQPGHPWAASWGITPRMP